MRKIDSRKNKKGAMEMSMGTIVTIILLVSVLVLGIVLIQKIFKGATSAVDLSNTQLTDQINKLFSQDATAQLEVYPQSRETSIAKGKSGGFGFSIRNTDTTNHTFSYNISLVQKSSSCQMTDAQVENLITLGGSGTGISIPSGSMLQNAILVKMDVPQSATLCDIRYGINVYVKNSDGTTTLYLPTVTFDLSIT